jgi:hypothetical protein
VINAKIYTYEKSSYAAIKIIKKKSSYAAMKIILKKAALLQLGLILKLSNKAMELFHSFIG